jgi:iron complex outermembrane receptor protein
MHNQGRYRAGALYGDAIWHLTTKTNLTAGLRLTRDQKRFSWHNPLRSAAGLDAQLDGLDAAGLFPALVAAGALSQAEADGLKAASRNNMLVATSGATAAPLTIQRSWTDLSPRLVLDHKLDGGPMIYASLTRGYQAGGFNTLQVNSVFEPEHVSNAELGLKGQSSSLGLSYSAALFHYRFDNLQTMDLVPASTAGGLPAYQVTISDQQASGLDLDLQWQATQALRLGLGAELINQTYRRGRSSDGQDLSGQAVGTPRLSASVGANYLWAAFGGQASSGLQFAYSSAQRCNPESYVQGQCFEAAAWRVGGPRQRWDLRLGWDSQARAKAGDGGWGLALIVNNLLNEQPVHKIWFEAAPLGSAYATLARPRSLALELHASY